MRFLIRCVLAQLLLVAGQMAWAVDSCSDAPPQDFEPEAGMAHKKVKIKADQIDFPGRKVVVLHGYTQLIRGGHRVRADELVYDKVNNEAEARGSVTLQTPRGDRVETSVLTYDINTGVAVSGPARFSIANRPSEFLGSDDSTVNAHGVAERVTFESEDIMLLENAEVTSCLDGKEDITFQAEALRVDLNKGVRTGTRVKIRITDPGKHKRLSEVKKLLN
jgi:lipopolysaccharide assembly outer membrane protein LptD (OstA)